jgi:hypothetical protein
LDPPAQQGLLVLMGHQGQTQLFLARKDPKAPKVRKVRKVQQVQEEQSLRLLLLAHSVETY